MTFEDFFIKKNIDLNALKRADAILYDEFQKHYALMGEKSFDHTKKFWFNRLRKDYKLLESTAQQPLSKNTTVPIAQAEEQVATTTSTAPKPAGFQPRFKAGATSVPKQEEKTDNTQQAPAESNIPAEPTQQTAKPTGFKPRFKAGATTVNKQGDKTDNTQQAPTESNIPAEPTQQAAKPNGFKPRFKAGATTVDKQGDKTDNTQQKPTENNIPAEPTQQAAKPNGFKPRFKAGATTVNKQEDKTDNTQQAPAESNIPAEPTQQAAKPTGFKPRFKAGATTVNKQQDKTDSIEDATPPISANPSNEVVSPSSSQPPKPLGFKPKFKAGATKAQPAVLPESAIDPDAMTSADSGSTTLDKSANENPKDAEKSTSTSPLGFKPRFRAGITKIDKSNEDSSSED
ncbi:hypothetical protein [Sphingobacterium sp. SYP-B4668]|uniref:hypothetical protein n=1 Tax=Sphingobacterium sp. SYP-B4668 TaxID=2996035 RepID=UPI0022DE4773|nr:hypothetical protein [Sphingobacterium sp. SYP-B4668]